MRTLFVVALVSSLVACKSSSPKPAAQPKEEPPPSEPALIKAAGPHVDGVPDELTAAFEAQVVFLEQLADAMVAAGDCAAMTQVMRDASEAGQPIFQALAEQPDFETHAETLMRHFVDRLEPADGKIGEASDLCMGDDAFMEAAADLGFE